MMKNAEAQDLLDNAYLFTYKALVKCCPKTVVARAYALLHCLGEITYLRFSCTKTLFDLNKRKPMIVWLILSVFETEKYKKLFKRSF